MKTKDMKKFKVKFLVKHESYNGYEHSDGWHEYIVDARNPASAEKKQRSCGAKTFIMHIGLQTHQSC